MDTSVFRHMSYGVYIVSTMDGERPTGCIANSIMQVTSSPATVAVSINHDNYTNGCIGKTGKFAFSILAEDSDAGLIGNFGFRSGRDADKFRSVDYEMVQGMPVVKHTCGYVVCRVVDRMETSTHTVFLGEVLDGVVYGDMGDAMTYAYYHKVVKGKARKMRRHICRRKTAEWTVRMPTPGTDRGKMPDRKNMSARYAGMSTKDRCRKDSGVPFAGWGRISLNVRNKERFLTAGIWRLAYGM